MDLSGRRILVTGAGKGIGRATALLLARLGARVVAVGRTAADLESLSGETSCETVQADLADSEAVEGLIARAGKVDDLVNCAGTTTLEPAMDFRLETFEEIMAVNVRAPLALSRDFARQAIDRGAGGSIVNVSSIASTVGIRDHLVYCASKGALDAATRVMALEYGPHGIRANAVNPVVTLTPMAVKAWSDADKARPMLQRIPMGRFVEPEEVAEAVAFLLGPAAAMLNGICLPVDGGFTAV
ncbi:SDR family oxidoreductase [Aureimonas altamirensis]|uniref:SDR family oxidoreductase n=1 Tax=Aureimonas altamirensis TaxID=370622 RepID=UPI00203731EA|nr:SDR family oxidoreductase [Aureimonas altamirensis]MCM2502154.1 SDR family oxidoreductase [Aureimonas altamirensis]